jgi:hypothetical protein
MAQLATINGTTAAVSGVILLALSLKKLFVVNAPSSSP